MPISLEEIVLSSGEMNLNVLSINILLQGLLIIIIVLVFIYVVLKIKNMKMDRVVSMLNIQLKEVQSNIEDQIHNGDKTEGQRKTRLQKLIDLDIGMKVAKPVVNHNGDILIKDGERLNIENIKLLADNDVMEVEVYL